MFTAPSSSSSLTRGAIRSAALIVFAIAAAGAVALVSHRAGAVGQNIAPAADPTCASSGACIEYQNSGSGEGVDGVGDTGSGLEGTSTSGAGVRGHSTSGYGVYGSSSSTAAVRGSSTSSEGILGYEGTASTQGIPFSGAVVGSSENSIALAGYSDDNYGFYARSLTSNGAVGITYNASTSSDSKYGVWGADDGTGSYNFGVLGTSTDGTGIKGSSTDGNGVAGYTSNPSKTTAVAENGVIGTDDSSDGGALNSGVAGYSTHGIGVSGDSEDGDAMQAVSADGTALNVEATDGTAINASSTNGIGLYLNAGSAGVSVSSNDSDGVEAVSNSLPAVYGDSNFDYGIEGFGSAAGVLGVCGSPDESEEFEGMSFTATLNFAVSCTGEASVTTKTRNGMYASAVLSRSTLPTIEDYGQGQLVNGEASVQLDPAFAASISTTAPYLVFLTPDGDTNGLYVQSKTLQSFEVREIHHGTSTLTFDYRIVARVANDMTPRMALQARAPQGGRLAVVRRRG